jgi:hypothetical protein
VAGVAKGAALDGAEVHPAGRHDVERQLGQRILARCRPPAEVRVFQPLERFVRPRLHIDDVLHQVVAEDHGPMLRQAGGSETR